MTPWEVIEGALARKRPKRNQAWLAAQLGMGMQAVTNWKTRGVPKARYEELADLLGLTLAQVAGREPVPWETPSSDWPFPDIPRERWTGLTEMQKGEIQAKVREMIEAFEALRATASGKSSGSGQGANQSRKTA